MYSNSLFVRVFSLSLLILLSCFPAFSQTGKQSLLNQWKKIKSQKNYQSDTSNVILLNHISDQYLYKHADSALYFSKQALELAKYQKFDLGQALSLNNIGKSYYVMGDYTLSIDAADRLMGISNKINYQPGIAGAYQINGLIYLAQNNYKEAINNFSKALAIFSRQKIHSKEGKIYFDLGICYDESGQPEKAFYYLDKALETTKLTRDSDLIPMILNRFGETYFHLKNYKQALVYYQRVLNPEFTNNWEKGFAYSGIARTFYALGAYDKAIGNAGQSLNLSRKVNSAFDAVRALEILSKSYAAIKDYQHAYIYQTQLKKSNDSLFNAEKEKEINYLHLKQQQADNLRLQDDIEAKEQTIMLGKRLFIFRNIIALCVIIFIIIIVRNIRRQIALNKVLKLQNSDIALQKEEISRQKEELYQINHTKDQLFSVISHDLRSPFAAILQTMELIRSGDISADEQANILNDFYQQVNLVTLMVNNLLLWASSQQSGIKSNLIRLNIAGAVNEIISISNFQAKNKNINLDYSSDGERWAYADPDHVKIIIQNLIGNAIKFTPKGGTVEIYFSEDINYQAIHVKDTGIGISPEKMDKLFKITGKEISSYGTNNESGAGIGLILIKQFIDANNGKLDVQSVPGGGTEFTVYFRKS